MSTLYLDIETVPQEPTCDAIAPRKDEESDGDYNKRLSCSAISGKIVCLGYYHESKVDHQTDVLEGDEYELLYQFWHSLVPETTLFVGHNILDFDLRFILQRSIILSVKPTRNISFARFRQNPVFDTMHEWSKWGRDYVKLDYLARALGVPTSKDSMDGSLVYPAYLEGRISDIETYCKKDVETTRAVYRRMTFQDLPVTAGVTGE